MGVDQFCQKGLLFPIVMLLTPNPESKKCWECIHRYWRINCHILNIQDYIWNTDLVTKRPLRIDEAPKAGSELLKFEYIQYSILFIFIPWSRYSVVRPPFKPVHSCAFCSTSINVRIRNDKYQCWDTRLRNDEEWKGKLQRKALLLKLRACQNGWISEKNPNTLWPPTRALAWEIFTEKCSPICLPKIMIQYDKIWWNITKYDQIYDQNLR